eukprot:ctg_372.g235
MVLAHVLIGDREHRPQARFARSIDAVVQRRHVEHKRHGVGDGVGVVRGGLGDAAGRPHRRRQAHGHVSLPHGHDARLHLEEAADRHRAVKGDIADGAQVGRQRSLQLEVGEFQRPTEDGAAEHKPEQVALVGLYQMHRVQGGVADGDAIADGGIDVGGVVVGDRRAVCGDGIVVVVVVSAGHRLRTAFPARGRLALTLRKARALLLGAQQQTGHGHRGAPGGIARHEQERRLQERLFARLCARHFTRDAHRSASDVMQPCGVHQVGVQRPPGAGGSGVAAVVAHRSHRQDADAVDGGRHGVHVRPRHMSQRHRPGQCIDVLEDAADAQRAARVGVKGAQRRRGGQLQSGAKKSSPIRSTRRETGTAATAPVHSPETPPPMRRCTAGRRPPAPTPHPGVVRETFGWRADGRRSTDRYCRSALRPYDAAARKRRRPLEGSRRPADVRRSGVPAPDVRDRPYDATAKKGGSRT